MMLSGPFGGHVGRGALGRVSARVSEACVSLFRPLSFRSSTLGYKSAAFRTPRWPPDLVRGRRARAWGIATSDFVADLRRKRFFRFVMGSAQGERRLGLLEFALIAQRAPRELLPLSEAIPRNA